MWIEQLSNGKYKYSERYKHPYSNKLKKVTITLPNKSRQTQKEAQIILNNKIANALNKGDVKNQNLTFKELYDEWYEVYQKQVAEGTYLPTKNALKRVIRDIGEDTLVSNINTLLLNEILDRYIYKDNLSNKYVTILKTKINLIMKYAIRKGYIKDNPVDKVELNFKREFKTEKIKDKFLEDDEYKKIIDYTEKHNERYSLLFQWLYLTGMRPGEALALQKSDIHDDKVTINGTLLYRERKVSEMVKSERTKTAAGMREIDLPPKALVIVEELLKLSPKGDFLFQTSNGTPLSLNAINTYLRNHKVKMGLPPDKPLSSHIFRHTHISKLAEIGTPMYVIQDRVGHEDSKITQQIYLHVTKKTKEKLKSDLEKL